MAENFLPPRWKRKMNMMMMMMGRRRKMRKKKTGKKTNINKGTKPEINLSFGYSSMHSFIGVTISGLFFLYIFYP